MAGLMRPIAWSLALGAMLAVAAYAVVARGAEASCVPPFLGTWIKVDPGQQELARDEFIAAYLAPDRLVLRGDGSAWLIRQEVRLVSATFYPQGTPPEEPISFTPDPRDPPNGTWSRNEPGHYALRSLGGLIARESVILTLPSASQLVFRDNPARYRRHE